MQRYDGSTALVVVDVQNDFADPKGSLSVDGGAALIPVINLEIRRARSSHSVLVATQDWHPESTPHFAKDGGIWPVHCVGGTWGAELYPGLVLPEVPAGPQGQQRRGRLLGLHDARPGDRGGDPDRARRPPPRTRHQAGRHRRPRDRLLRPGHGARCGAARLPNPPSSPTRCAAVNLQQGDGERALEAMRDAGVAIWQTRMR